MSWSTESRSTASLAKLGLLLALISIASGCYDAHVCGTEETCNLYDDDCDGLIDEGFVSDDGVYRTVDHCGTCGINCSDAFPTAAEVACQETAGSAGPVCALVSCPLAFHRAGDGACVPDVPVLCLACEEDDDCALRVPGARCLETGSGQSRCGQPCDGDTAPCPDGFMCRAGQCAPLSGWCGCDASTEDAELACLLNVEADGHACVGVQRCGPTGPGECEPALVEACNASDDDCDGEIDEDFRDAEGRYVARLHCGGCAIPCVEPGPNMEATCAPSGATVTCEVGCLEGFVDVDGILANGCECERFDGTGPPPAVGGDADCDGVSDDTDDFIYVTTAGSDTNPGTLARPMRTLNASLARGRAERKSVLVSRGIYEGPLDVLAGVSIFGGYSPDFRDRDLELFPVVIERTVPGLPSLTCTGVRTATTIDGFTVMGGDAVGAGEGSTALFFDGCGAEVQVRSFTVQAGRGSDGANGLDSSMRLGEIGFDSLDDLNGIAGNMGRPGNEAGVMCTLVAGGLGGRQSCGATNISGGTGGASDCAETGCVNGRPCGNAGCTDFTVAGMCDFDAVLRAATPNPAAVAGRGPNAGAAGELTYNSPTNRGVCNFCDDNPTLARDSAHGGDGGPGVDGSGGSGCSPAPLLDASTGRVRGDDGSAGTGGENGSGGGGASSGAGYDVIGGTDGTCIDRSGGSGGGGGSGGCGAPAATGGGGGGTSVGIVVRLPTGIGRGPVFSNVRVVTASGGQGGNGGVGADGGSGGVGGNGGVGRVWCARTGGRGGDGGRGGAGGGGGGGCGGGSHGVFLVTDGADPAMYEAELVGTLTIETTGVPGRGGSGGFSPGENGTPGLGGDSSTVFIAP